MFLCLVTSVDDVCAGEVNLIYGDMAGLIWMPRSPQGKFISFKTCIFISSSQSQRYLNDSAFLLEYLHHLVWNWGLKKKRRKTEKGKKIPSYSGNVF